MKIFYFTIVTALALGCAKKESVIYQKDPLPQGTFRSKDFEMQEVTEGKAIVLKRDDMSGGPKISVDAPKNKITSKNLNCGPLSLQGTGDGGESLRLNEEEFPGFKNLPRVSPCLLKVTIANENGSTNTLSMALTLEFDKNPALEITEMVATEGMAPLYGGNTKFPLDFYTIKNPLDYPVGFTFRPSRHALGRIYHNFYGAGIQGYGREQYEVKADVVYVNAEGAVAVSPDDYRFVVPPGETVTIQTFMRLRDDWIQPVVVANTAFVTIKRVFEGVYLTSLSSVADDQSLLQWNSFERSNLDDERPNPAEKTVLPIGGFTVDPNLNQRIIN